MRALKAASLLALVLLMPLGARALTIDTQAKNAFMIDATTGTILLEKNPDQLIHPASMSKLMTMHLVFERLKAGKLKLDDMLPVSERAWKMGGSKMFVDLNTSVKVEDLIRGVIVQSGNDACVVLAEGLSGSEEAFAEEMTRRAKELGLTNSTFKNSTGWPDPGHFMTARDLAILAQRMILDFPEYYHYYSELNFNYHNIKQGNRNPLLYKGSGFDGLKTGHTEEAGYGLTASAQRNGQRLIMVLTGLPSMKARASEAERVMEWGFREYAAYALFKPGETVEDVPVWLGEQKTVKMVAGAPIGVTLPRTMRKDLKVAVAYTGPVPAPIKKGDTIGQLKISAPGIPDASVPLVAGEDVPRLGMLGRVGATVGHFLFGI